MRIIAGKYRGRNIQTPKGLPVRPTTDRTKEALFNILNNEIDWQETHVLDLFAGTGNITYECLSRGAASVTSVDQHHRCIGTIRSTLKLLGEDGSGVVKANVWSFVKQHNRRYQLIFMDPPYHMPRQEELIALIFSNGLLAEGGLMVIEHASQYRFDSLDGFDFTRNYGGSSLSFFRSGGE